MRISLIRDMRRMLGIATAGLALYVVSRYTTWLAWLPANVARNHLGDLAGGLVFGAYVDALALVVAKRRLLTSWPRTLALWLLATFVWEGLAPYLITSTADVIDTAAYLAGFSIYHVILNTPRTRRPEVG